ncbi:hypothetical protein CFIMG_002844RA [Ceratocystis fimbriata CBS 114723]|uniref:Rhodopsin domain-containing protein n=2 Tax=Ceratocystis TaxID=5157 RepID=A0A2C5X2U0_9PEZI|nr:hypothetical protein CFIMG_002844RA [Ceratocystis fimbriata CBS 114723]
MSSKAIEEAIAAGRVPEGIEDRLYKSTESQTIVAIIFVGSLSTLVVAVRLFSRLFIVKHVGIDDGLALLTLIAFVVLCVILIRLGSGRHFEYIEYVMPMNTVENSEILDFAAHIIYTTSLLIGRLSGLAFYYRLCKMHNTFRMAIFIVGGLIVAGFLPQILLIIFHCLPVTGLWPYSWQPGAEKYTCLKWGLVYSVNSATSLLCDFLIFGIPIAMLRGLDMNRKRKIQLTCILLPGVFVIGISVTRLVFVIKGQWEADMSWSYNPMLAIEVSEIGATLIALSVPGIKPVFDLFCGRLKSASKVSYASARSRFQPNSQHLSSTENLKSMYHRNREGHGRGGFNRDFELESTGSGDSGQSDGHGLEVGRHSHHQHHHHLSNTGVTAGNGAGTGAAICTGTGTVVTAGKSELVSSVASDEDHIHSGSDAILVQVDFGIDEERGEPIPKDYGLKHFH